MPKANLDRLSSALATAMQAPDIKEALAAVGADPLYKGPRDYRAFIAAENQTWGKTVKAAGAEGTE